MKVKEMIEKLQELPQERTVVCQVVGQDDGAWNMQFDIKNVPHSDWMVVLTVSHPELKKLPMGDNLWGEN